MTYENVTSRIPSRQLTKTDIHTGRISRKLYNVLNENGLNIKLRITGIFQEVGTEKKSKLFLLPRLSQAM